MCTVPPAMRSAGLDQSFLILFFHLHWGYGIGSGVQARSHLRMHAQLFDFEQIRIWSRTPENAAAFATWCRTELALRPNTEVVVCSSGAACIGFGIRLPCSCKRLKCLKRLPCTAEAAVKDADIVNVCTASKACNVLSTRKGSHGQSSCVGVGKRF